MSKGYFRNVTNRSYLGEAYSPLEPDTGVEKFNKRNRSKTGQWKSNPAASGIVVWLDNLKGSEEVPSYELEEATEGLKPIKARGGIVIYRAEDYLVIVRGNR